LALFVGRICVIVSAMVKHGKTNNKGLNLRPEDVTTYNSPMVSFDEKVIIPRG